MSSQVSVSPRQGLNPRQAETAEKLFAAGLAELKAVGHEALTIRTVAARAGVSPATAYTYLASKNHLFAELFWQMLSAEAVEPDGADALARVQSTVRHLTGRLELAPELAAAVASALLGTDPDVERVRLRIGGEFVQRFTDAIGPDADPALIDALTLAFSGALLQAGMGLISYAELGDRLDGVVATIMRGH